MAETPGPAAGRKPRLLILTAAATRSGVPILTLHLARWLKQHSDFALSAVLVEDGVMAADFAALMPVEFSNPAVRHTAPVRWTLRRKTLARWRQARRVARCRSVVGTWPPDLVYCTSAGVAGLLDLLGPYDCPVVIGVHELEFVLGAIRAVRDGAVPAIRRHVDHYIAGSGAVRRNLIDRHGIRPETVSVVHDFIETDAFPPGAAVKADVAAAIPAPPGALVVGCVAKIEWRKGADLLVQVAVEVGRRATARPVHFVWVGGGEEFDEAGLAHDVRQLGLGDRVHLVGPTRQTADWYPAFSAFALLSREDPFPLVALEAAASGLPVLCFDGGGGMPEFVEDDAGITVPYLDVRAFADAIVRLAADEDLRQRLGRTAAEKVRARHDTRVAAPQVLARFEQLVAAGRHGSDQGRGRNTRPDQDRPI